MSLAVRLTAGTVLTTTTAGATEVVTQTRNKHNGKLTATKDFSYPTGKIEEDGKPEMKLVRKGQNIDISKNEALTEYVSNHKVAKAENGLVGKVMNSAQYKMADLRRSLSSDKPIESSTTSQDESTSHNSQEKTKNRTNHKDPLNSYKDIVPKSSETVNTLSEQIENVKKTPDNVTDKTRWKI